MFKARSLPSEMIISIIGDEYGSIFICTIVGFLHFLLVFPIFGGFGVSVGFGGVLGVLVSYKITRGIKLPNAQCPKMAKNENR